MKYLFVNKKSVLIYFLLVSFLLVSHSFLLANDSYNNNNSNYNYSNIHTTKCQTFSEKNRRRFLEYKNNPNSLQQDIYREKMQAFVISAKKQFRVHYDTIGINAVDKTDKDGNGIPDYIDSVCAIFDYVYTVEVEEMGMLRPRTDYAYANNDDFEYPNLLYDVYVKEIGNDIINYNNTSYGYTEYEYWGAYGGGNGYFPKYYTCIYIDNNYSPSDLTLYYNNNGGKIGPTYATTGIDGLKVTAAHEYHHSIQFAYGNDDNAASIYEMSAVCMEMLVYPDINDYLQYVNAMISDVSLYNFGSGFYDNGYSFGIFFYMMTQKYGTNAIKEYWELVSQRNSCYKALDSFFVKQNSSLSDEWLDFINWIYYSGKYADGKYFPMAMAKKFKPMIPNNYLPNSPTSISYYITPYELRFVRFTNNSRNNFILSDTLDIVFTNLNTDDLIIQPPNNNLMILCNANTSDTYLTEGEEIFKNFWYKISSNSEYMGSQIYTHLGGAVTSVSSVYPQPFNKNKDEYICFPISDDIIIGSKINLNIFDANFKSIFSAEVTTTTDNEKRVVKYNASDLEQGIYIFTTSGINATNADIIGKFVIK